MTELQCFYEMAPITAKKSWAEMNKERKEKRKKWKEEGLLKKLAKEEKAKESALQPAVQKPNKTSTVSIAIPGSILENAQSRELRTYLAGQIARASSIYQVDEVIVFDDYGDAPNVKKYTLQDSSGMKTARHSSVQLGRILQYLECPQYLRKYFFPLHKDLQYAGLLNPLDTPHHLRQETQFLFR